MVQEQPVMDTLLSSNTFWMETTNKVLPFLFNVGTLKENLLYIALICHYKEFQSWYMNTSPYFFHQKQSLPPEHEILTVSWSLTISIWHYFIYTEVVWFTTAKQRATDLSNLKLQVMRPVSGAVRGTAASWSAQQKQMQASTLLAYQPVSQTLTPQHNQIWREKSWKENLILKKIFYLIVPPSRGRIWQWNSLQT